MNESASSENATPAAFISSGVRAFRLDAEDATNAEEAPAEAALESIAGEDAKALREAFKAVRGMSTEKTVTLGAPSSFAEK